MPELLIVLIIIAILAVIALPQIIASRRAFRFSGMQRQVAATLNEARQEAMTERAPVTARYQDSDKTIVIYGGKFGAAGAGANRVEQLSGAGVSQGEIIYGRPSGISTGALADGTNVTAISGGKVEITFQADGAVVDASNNPDNRALFFYDSYSPSKTAFAVSVLGAAGRIKLWRYSAGVNSYVE